MALGFTRQMGFRRERHRRRGLGEWLNAVCRSTEALLAAPPAGFDTLRGDLQCDAPARAISLAGAAWPLCPWDRHCCGSGVVRRDSANRLAPNRDSPACGAHRRVRLSLVSWFKARASVEVEALDRVRRKVRAASVLGPALTFAFALTTAISTWQDGVVEFALALVAVWVVAAVCAICLNRIASEAKRYRRRRDRAAHRRIPGPRRGLDARPRGAGRHRRLLRSSACSTSTSACSPKSCGRAS